jgi:hypothetical protein
MSPPDSVTEFNRGHHRLKVDPQFFDDLVNGRKSFEVRLDDRNFKVGDILHLWEWGSSGLREEAQARTAARSRGGSTTSLRAVSTGSRQATSCSRPSER